MDVPARGYFPLQAITARYKCIHAEITSRYKYVLPQGITARLHTWLQNMLLLKLVGKGTWYRYFHEKLHPAKVPLAGNTCTWKQISKRLLYGSYKVT